MCVNTFSQMLQNVSKISSKISKHFIKDQNYDQGNFDFWSGKCQFFGQGSQEKVREIDLAKFIGTLILILVYLLKCGLQTVRCIYSYLTVQQL